MGLSFTKINFLIGADCIGHAFFLCTWQETFLWGLDTLFALLSGHWLGPQPNKLPLLRRTGVLHQGENPQRAEVRGLSIRGSSFFTLMSSCKTGVQLEGVRSSWRNQFSGWNLGGGHWGKRTDTFIHPIPQDLSSFPWRLLI